MLVCDAPVAIDLPQANSQSEQKSSLGRFYFPLIRKPIAEALDKQDCTSDHRANSVDHRYPRVLGIDHQMLVHQVSRKAREKLSRTGFIMYSKNVRSPVLM
jgi:hypothetical protein